MRFFYDKIIVGDNMFYELTDDIFYKEYRIYDDSIIDYCILKSNIEIIDLSSHKKALLFAMNIINKRYKYHYKYNENKMAAKKINKEDLFNDSYDKFFLSLPMGIPNKRCYQKDNSIVIERKNYTKKDFDYLNSLLFPKDINNLEIYEWTTDWSDYFDEGNEWFGSKCLSIYDFTTDRFIIIMASVSD